VGLEVRNVQNRVIGVEELEQERFEDKRAIKRAIGLVVLLLCQLHGKLAVDKIEHLDLDSVY
jgi:hypothetical protein